MMDDLDANPLYRAFMTKFRREFEIACKMSYIIAIPHSDTLDNVNVDQFLANSHILMPSKLLKMHYTPLQVGFSDDIEIDGKRLIVHFGKKRPTTNRLIVNILAEEIGYNSFNKEYKTLLIEQPLLNANNNHRPLFIRSILAPFSSSSFSSPSSSSYSSSSSSSSSPMAAVASSMTPNAATITRRSFRGRPPKPLANHDDCLKYLECISQEITIHLENDVKRLQSNYLILSEYLDDAATRIKSLIELYTPKYEASLERRGLNLLCDSVSRAICLSIENYVIHLLHGKLMASIQSRHQRNDRKLLEKFDQIQRAKLTICQLGAQLAFSDFTLSEEILRDLQLLPTLQSPLALVSSLMKLVNLISEALNQSARFRHLMGAGGCERVSICSDDLIASFIYALARAKPANLYSISKYLETFGWSSNAKDQAAYYTATFQIVVQYVLSYKDNNNSCTTNDDDKLPAVAATSRGPREAPVSSSGSMRKLVVPSNDHDEYEFTAAADDDDELQVISRMRLRRNNSFAVASNLVRRTSDRQFVDSLDSRGSTITEPDTSLSSATSKGVEWELL